MEQIFGVSHAHLTVFALRVSQIVRIADFLQPRVFNTATFFIWRLRNHDRFGPAIEMNTVAARGVPQRRSTVMVLRAVKHDVLSILLYYGRIKGSCGFEPLAAWRQDRVGGKPLPLSKS